MNHTGIRFALLALVLSSTGLAQKVHYNFDQEAGFSAYKT